jgi:hypothetical protein
VEDERWARSFDFVVNANTVGRIRGVRHGHSLDSGI